MKLTNKIEEEVKQVMNDYWDAYFRGDLKHWANFLVTNYRNIGTTEEEVWNSKKEIVDYSHRVIEQMKGIVELRNRTSEVISFEPYIMVHEYGEMFLKLEGDWVFYQKFRLSTLLQKVKEEWKILHQHGSFPDSKIQEGEAVGTDVLKAENEKLQKAVLERTTELEEKNRALQIEAALERIRAQATAMKQSADLLDVVVTLRTEFLKLGHEAHYFWHMLWLPEKYEKAMTSGDGTRIGFVMELPRHIHGDIPLLANWEKSDEPTVIYPMDTEEALAYVHKMVTLGDFQHIDPQAPSDDDIRHIGGLTFNMARTTHGEIGYSLPGVVTNPPPEDLDILVRFAGAFDLAHLRFLDLKKAEEQAREVQIELALEKVRSRTMAMQKSEELPEAANNLFLQVQELGIPAWSAGYCIWERDKKNVTAHMSSEGVLQKPFILPNVGVGYNFQKPLDNGKTFHIEELGGEAIVKHYEFMRTLPIFGEIIDGIIEAGFPLPTFQIFHIVYFRHGYVMFITYESVPEAHDIFKRFGKVFEQTYTRFLDLQKAEAQARESQIEAAVERVRAEAMAMHSTTDFEKVVRQLLEQVKLLDLEGFTGAQIILIDEKEFLTTWDFSSPGNISDPKNQTIYYDAHKFPIMGLEVLNKWKEGEAYFVLDFDLEKLKTAVKEWEDINVDIAKALNDAISGGHLTHQWDACGRLSNGMIAFDMLKPPDDDVKNITIKMTHAFEQAYIRFLDLQKAEAQARESQIEAALEKIRSRSLAMQNPDELKEVVGVVAEKLQELGVILDAGGVIICTYFPENKDVVHWIAQTDFSTSGKYFIPYFDDLTFNDAWNSKQCGDAFFTKAYTKEEKNRFFYYAFKHTDYKDFPDDFKKFVLESEQIVLSFAWAENSAIMLPSHKGIVPSDDDINIIKRFSKVFEQAYTRFLDLKKAEEQSREAQIEAALERIRSSALAMHKSDELLNVGALLYQELSKLGIDKLTSMFVLVDDEKRIASSYGVNPQTGEIRTIPVIYKLTETKFLKSIYASWKKKEPFLIQQLNPQQTIRHQTYMAEKAVNFLFTAEQLLKMSPKRLIINSFNFEQGYLLLVGGILLKTEQQEILSRFAKVFEQTYIRFLDLQKAEAQAREAKIEAALEKVRSSSLSVNKIDEFNNVVEVVFEKLSKLDIPASSVTIVVNKKDAKNFEVFGCGESEAGLATIKFELPYFSTSIMDDLINLRVTAQEGYYSKVYSHKEKNDYYEYAFKNTALKNLPNDLKQQVWQSKSYGLSVAYTTNSSIMVNDFEGNVLAENQVDILKRFSRVFEQAYIRFLDLQKAEARARESQIEAALEKVRSQTMSMQHPDELEEVVTIVVEKLTDLGVVLDANGVIICTYFKDSKDILHWTASPDFTFSGRYLLPYFDHPILIDAWNSKLSGDEYFSKAFSVEEKNTFYEHAFEHSDYKHFPDEFKEWIFKNDKHSLSFAWSKNSAILVPSHTGIVPNEAEVEILKRFAKVFEQAYIRFLDLQVKEEQAIKLYEEKQRLEKTLEHLQKTQKQLIQSEKMASLGELTAGIAHEIQNPLNFVNNFSEVSVELIDEAIIEIDTDSAEVKVILTDIRGNLEKISHHGKRADSIVKGMLQHSRNSTGDKVPTDINVLCDEYTRLSYHGLRAKDQSFNAKIEMDLDESIGLVAVIPQDMSRVILNIVTNAFQACSKATSTDQSVSTNLTEESNANADRNVLTDLEDSGSRSPKIKVTTKNLGDNIEISVSDNGPGIPDNIKDKIFQPFFTTKPTGQGTGLGLSLAFDIVTKGLGGELRVESVTIEDLDKSEKETPGSTFIISIPNKLS